MSKRKNKGNKGTAPPPKTRDGFVKGLIGGAALVAVAIVLFGQVSARDGEPDGATARSAPVAMDGPVPRPVPQFSTASVSSASRISVDETKQLLDSGEAVVIDVRDVRSYEAAHIPGAWQIPLAYVEGEIPWFPADKKLITYCT